MDSARVTFVQLYGVYHVWRPKCKETVAQRDEKYNTRRTQTPLEVTQNYVQLKETGEYTLSIKHRSRQSATRIKWTQCVRLQTAVGSRRNPYLICLTLRLSSMQDVPCVLKTNVSNCFTLLLWNINQIQSNQIRFISGNMAHKSYKLVQKQRQTEKERNKNIQHTTHSTY